MSSEHVMRSFEEFMDLEGLSLNTRSPREFEIGRAGWNACVHEVREVIRTEEEFDGPIPEDLLKTLKDMPLEDVIRLVVKVTKNKLLERIGEEHQ